MIFQASKAARRAGDIINAPTRDSTIYRRDDFSKVSQKNESRATTSVNMGNVEAGVGNRFYCASRMRIPRDEINVTRGNPNLSLRPA